LDKSAKKGLKKSGGKGDMRFEK